jgi:hypothetical protein
LQHRAANESTVIGEDLRHAQLDSDNSVNRHRLFSLFAACLVTAGYWLRTASVFIVTSLLHCFFASISYLAA